MIKEVQLMLQQLETKSQDSAWDFPLDLSRVGMYDSSTCYSAPPLQCVTNFISTLHQLLTACIQLKPIHSTSSLQTDAQFLLTTFAVEKTLYFHRCLSVCGRN